MDAYVRLWYCLTRWGVVTKIFYLCIRVHMHAYVYVCACMCVWVHVYMYVHLYMYVCVYVCKHIHIRARVGVHIHSCRRILFICTVQSLYYMRVYTHTCTRTHTHTYTHLHHWDKLTKKPLACCQSGRGISEWHHPKRVFLWYFDIQVQTNLLLKLIECWSRYPLEAIMTERRRA